MHTTSIPTAGGQAFGPSADIPADTQLTEGLRTLFTATELTALAASGALRRVGSEYLPTALPSSPLLRACTLPVLPTSLVFARCTAVWLWTGQCEPPRIQIAPRAGRRFELRANWPQLDLRRSPVADADTVEIQGRTVTSLTRTTIDVARATDSALDAVALLRLAEQHPAALDEARRRIQVMPRLPYKGATLKRIDQAALLATR